MSKTDSSIAGFFGWINERHAIWHRRNVEKLPRPWSQDEIFLDYKFTNTFRELDRGTIALHEMIDSLCHAMEVQDFEHTKEKRTQLAKELVFNVMWYRLFNCDFHAKELGYCLRPEQVIDYMQAKAKRGEKIFTSAHLCTVRPGKAKVDSYTEAVMDAWDDAHIVVEACRTLRTMKGVYDTLKQFYLIGGFVAYEITCDLRFTPLLQDPVDRLRWANIGPGADRGMCRLGLSSTINTMVCLHRLAIGDWSKYTDSVDENAFEGMNTNDIDIINDANFQGTRVGPHVLNAPVPFELREIEHSLCEFDKFERVRLGQGRPRQKFNGRTDG